jgi:predicted patatin/cPLA2 family phospholipase
LLECRNSSFLALSGGGANGAFGAGVLYGWSQVGTRPKFQIVTGVSTGALIAPFAFLGPEYDDKLKDAYTTVESRDIFNICGFTGIFQIFFGESFAQTKPLAGLIEKMFTEKELIGIAAEHAKGRRLYIGTTNLDTQQFVIWDMGAIASSENPEALKIFRKVLLASASIPGAFPPVYFDVETNGEKYSEIHVDGGVIAGVFGYGSLLFEDILKSKTGMNKARSIYVIMNNKIEAEYQQTQPNFLKIVDRSFMTLMKAQSWNDLSRIYNSAQKNNVDFNYIAIPDNYIFSKKRGFDKKEMNKLFELGCNLAKSGTFWNKSITIYPNPDL